MIEGDNARTELDLAADARLFPVETGRIAPTLAGEELATDKLLAVFGRAEARDFIDLLSVVDHYGLQRLCELAMEKDRGFTPDVFAEMLGRFDRLRREEFDIDDPGYERLALSVGHWRQEAIQPSRSPDLELDREDDMGLDL